ncbi:MAG: DUF1178 family protein [Paucibacter sp.]|nr:DUF1178 family protein [Roseateles sp.]
MIVLNLACEHGHTFEGWFGSSFDFAEQQARGLVTCPICGHADVHRMPSAPRLNVSHLKSEKASGIEAKTGPSPVPASKPVPQTLPQELQRQVLQAVQQLVANTEDVGEQFAEQARKMHYGEIEHRGIRGQTSLDEAQALIEEGIEVMPVPLPELLKGTVQ